MEITKTRTLKVNMGNWEHIEEFYRVTANTEDLRIAGLMPEDIQMSLDEQALMLMALCNKTLDAETEKFLEKCRVLTAMDDSFCLAETTPAQPAEAPPAQAKKRIRRP